ncbi:DNA-binding response regulator [Thalassotalea insulae]|uniref:DNA-binding response regulator n=1 Tax=Thalassotalea insulae TaxID=2056778 RepID=A0ABQ6GTU5_9GAMM|nr:response regulator [Thalassotalea insulae]GLX79348.1 DNA-binding response regulator [Thalassotalea insulae]
MNSPSLSPYLLIVEDDQDLAEWMQSYLQKKGFEVEITGCGLAAVNLIQTTNPDLVILDGMLPNLDGIEVCRQVRPTFTNTIIMVTARDEEIDEVLGLEMGADDYLTKPVRARALLARINKHLAKQQHQTQENSPQRLHFNQLVIDHSARTVSLAGELVKISSHEFDLLWILATQAGEVVSRQALVNELRGFDYDGFDRSIDLKVSRLRKKLGDSSNDPYRIKTVWGKGYLFIKEAW